MRKVSSLFTWSFLPAVVAFNAAYFLAGMPTMAAFLALFGSFSLIYSYFRTLSVPIKDRAVVVTGCDSGFGNALAERLHALGFTVFACFLDDKSYTSQGLQSIGTETGRMHIIKMDVTDQNQVDEAKRYVESHLPDEGLWGIVNNAGLYNVGFLEWVPMDVMERVASVNLFGAIRVTRAFLPLVRRTQGRIINVSSLTAVMAVPFTGAYNIAKRGLEAFNDTLRLEMKPFKVKVITINPGNFLAANVVSGETAVQAGDPARMARHFWDQLGDAVQRDYGKQILEKELRSIHALTTIANKDMGPVIRDLIDSLVKLYPLNRYIEASLGDRAVTYLSRMLPTFLSDKLVLSYQNQLLRLYGERA
jgi:3-hydroxybutyrate dehydrogenase